MFNYKGVTNMNNRYKRFTANKSFDDALNKA